MLEIFFKDKINWLDIANEKICCLKYTALTTIQSEIDIENLIQKENQWDVEQFQVALYACIWSP